MHDIVDARIESGLLNIRFVHIGIGSLFEDELHVGKRSIGVNIVVGKFGDRLHFRRNITWCLRKDIAFGKTLYGIRRGTRRILLFVDYRSRQIDNQFVSLVENVVLRRSELDTETVLAVDLLDISGLVALRRIDRIISRIRVILSVLLVLVADCYTLDDSVRTAVGIIGKILTKIGEIGARRMFVTIDQTRRTAEIQRNLADGIAFERLIGRAVRLRLFREIDVAALHHRFGMVYIHILRLVGQHDEESGIFARQPRNVSLPTVCRHFERSIENDLRQPRLTVRAIIDLSRNGAERLVAGREIGCVGFGNRSNVASMPSRNQSCRRRVRTRTEHYFLHLFALVGWVRCEDIVLNDSTCGTDIDILARCRRERFRHTYHRVVGAVVLTRSRLNLSGRKCKLHRRLVLYGRIVRIVSRYDVACGECLRLETDVRHAVLDGNRTFGIDGRSLGVIDEHADPVAVLPCETTIGKSGARLLVLDGERHVDPL